jgi:hypothetical protein
MAGCGGQLFSENGCGVRGSAFKQNLRLTWYGNLSAMKSVTFKHLRKVHALSRVCVED